MKNFKNFEEVVKQTVEERRARDITNICRYWIEILDDYCWGIMENELVVIWAGSWIWKTELSIQIAIENAMRWKKVALFSLEWDIWEIAYRYLQRHINKKLWKKFIKWPEYRLNLRDVEKIENEVIQEIPQELKDNIKIFDKTFIPDKKELLKLLSSGIWKVDLFVIDHLHYLDYGEKEREWISEIVKKVKETTEIIKTPVVLVSHLSRMYVTQKRRPTKTDLHWSSNIEKNANTIILLHPAPENELLKTMQDSDFLRGTEIIIDKHRTWMPTPAMFEATFDLRTKEYLKWAKYNYLSEEEQNRIKPSDKIFTN